MTKTKDMVVRIRTEADELNVVQGEIARLSGEPRITTVSEAESGVSVIKTLRGWRTRLKSKRDEILSPLREAEKRVRGLFDPLLKRIEELEGRYRGALVEFKEQQDNALAEQTKQQQAMLEEQVEKERQRLLQQAQKAKGEKKEELIRRANSLVIPVVQAEFEIPGVSWRTHWDVEIVDPEQVPGAYKVIDEEMLKKLAQVTNGTAQVPGVRFIRRKIPVIGE